MPLFDDNNNPYLRTEPHSGKGDFFAVDVVGDPLVRIPPGTDGQVPTYDSLATGGISAQDPAGGATPTLADVLTASDDDTKRTIQINDAGGVITITDHTGATIGEIDEAAGGLAMIGNLGGQSGSFDTVQIATALILTAGLGSISGVFVAQDTLNFGSTAAGASTDLTISVPGALDKDAVMLGVPIAAQLSEGVYTAFVSSSGVVTVRLTNNKLYGSLDPASGVFRVLVAHW